MRMLLTPEGGLPYDPEALAGALNKLGELKAREPEFGPSYPRVMADKGRWCRQNIPGGRLWPIPDDEARELFGIEAA